MANQIEPTQLIHIPQFQNTRSPYLYNSNLESSINNCKNKVDNKDYIVPYNLNIFDSNIKNKKKKIKTNEIQTSKYTWYNCIPKILIEQFSKMSNFYFLLITIFQCIKEISNSEGKPIMLMPLSIVICINGIKDFYEDTKRKKSDDEENNKDVLVFNNINNLFENKKWKDVVAGNIIKIKKDQFIPADCVLIGSDNKNNNCYVETKNLDGETSLKFKKCIKELLYKVKDNEYDDNIKNENNGNLNSKSIVIDIIDTNKNSSEELINNNRIKINEKKFKELQGFLITKPPNEFIYEFDAVFTFFSQKNIFSNMTSKSDINRFLEIKDHQNSENERISIDMDSFLLRGSSLKQTSSAYGLVVYVGHDTKIMKNSPKAQHKLSSIEKTMNMQIIFIFIFQIILCILSATFCLIKLRSGVKIPYLEMEDNSYGFKYFLIKLGTWVVLLNNLVPISLNVTMEMVKYVQGLFISWDCEMYDLNTSTQTKVQTSTLNEELGQVKYIFTDKTGTLTKNYMTFKKMTIGYISYGNLKSSLNSKELKDDYGDITNFDFYDENFNKDIASINDKTSFPNSTKEKYNKITNKINNKNKLHKDLIVHFLTALATCHSAIVNEKIYEENNKIVYNSSSPDETALLNCSRYFKYIFSGRDINNNIILTDSNGNKLIYELLCNFPYKSERKRMSVIVHDKISNKIYLYIKGADSVIMNKINSSDPYIENINQSLLEYSKEGLRTLVVAYKEISIEYYINNIKKDYKDALTSTNDKQILLDKLSEKIENDLSLLGITGIEDQLQDNVNSVLKDLNTAGIKVWVLTGDKKETAKAIAHSCGLLDSENLTLFDFNEGLAKNQLRKEIQNYSKIYNSKHINKNKNGNNSHDNFINNDLINNLIEDTDKLIDDNNNKINKGINIEKNSSIKIDSQDSPIQVSDIKNTNQNTNITLHKDNISKIPEKVNEKFAICISQEELSIIMSNSSLKRAFYELSDRCMTVLCCRVTPKQKAEVVKLVKEFQPSATTLAIGDGANDVNMITSANIGIGILGIEGKQAARASDYAIGQFQFIKKLLFVHGRESYRKNSFIVVFNFYKNFLFTIPQFILGFRSLFSGQRIYEDFIYQCFNICFAAFPIIWYGVNDKQLQAKLLMSNPKYYTQGIIGRLFGSLRFWKWVFYGLCQAFFVYIASFELVNSSLNTNGDLQDLRLSGTVCYSLVVIIANVKVIQASYAHSVVSFLCVFISIFLYYLFVFVQSFFINFTNYGNFTLMMGSFNYYLKVALIILLCSSIDLGLKISLKILGFIPDPLKIKIDFNDTVINEMNDKEEEDFSLHDDFGINDIDKELPKIELIMKTDID